MADPTEGRLKVRRYWRWWMGCALWLLGCVVWWHGSAGAQATVGEEPENWTIPPSPPVLLNGEFECAEGYRFATNARGETIHIPHGWTLELRQGSPVVGSTRLRYAYVCDQDDRRAFIERLSQWDSFIIVSEDIETPPLPGKPFDVLLYQQVDTTVGAEYSLSGWMISLCGNKSRPFDCPPTNVIVKRLGLDPSGGTDPEASSVVWVENRRNFVDEQGNRLGWQNMSVAATARATRMTVFVQMISPHQFHGNMGFVDALSLVRAPLVRLERLPETTGAGQVELRWSTRQSDDVAAIVGGTYRVLVDVQVRVLPSGPWRDFAVGVTDTNGLTFRPPCLERTYAFRVRARTEQSDGGVWPNQRYPGVWSIAQRVRFEVPRGSVVPAGPWRVLLPHVRMQSDC